MKEIDFQRKICKSIEKAGGFGRKWSSEWQAGPPDLVLSHQLIGGACFMEVKLIKSPPAIYNRNLSVTRLQREHLESLAKTSAKVCIGLVHYHPRKYWDLIVLPWNTSKFAFDFTNQAQGLHWTRQDLVHNVKEYHTLDVVGTLAEFFKDHGHG